jgi:predicted RecA/RadA family phage recombinase
MAGDFVSEQGSIKHTPGSDIAQGKLVVTNGRIAFASRAIAANTEGVLVTKGVIDYTKINSQAFNDGAQLYYDASNDRLTTTSSGNTLCGRAGGAAAETAVVARLDLNAT